MEQNILLVLNNINIKLNNVLMEKKEKHFCIKDFQQKKSGIIN